VGIFERSTTDLDLFKFLENSSCSIQHPGDRPAFLIKMARGTDILIWVVVIVIIIAIIICAYFCCRKPSIETVVSGGVPDPGPPSTGVRLFHLKLHCRYCYQNCCLSIYDCNTSACQRSRIWEGDWLYRMPATSASVHTRDDQSSGLHSGIVCQSNSDWLPVPSRVCGCWWAWYHIFSLLLVTFEQIPVAVAEPIHAKVWEQDVNNTQTPNPAGFKQIDPQ